MAVSTSSGEIIDYRYFLCDLMTNRLLVEVPFKSVNYSRSLNEAGTFTGDIAVTEDTYNLSIYENTLPGKTALYVVRNGVCVWGGIVWAREYSLIDRVLSVDATEFQSYFNHRVVWKTWSSDYEAGAVVSGGTATITLTNGQYGFTVGEPVFIDWGTELSLYSGTFDVDTASVNLDGKSVITVDADYIDASNNQKTIPDMGGGEPITVTVQTRQDTYEYARDLLTELATDLFDFDFANDDIRPGIDLFNEIQSIGRSGNVATVVTTQRHELSEGQKINITDVQSASGFDDQRAVVASVESDNTFTYVNSGPNISTSTESPTQATVTSFSRDLNIATFTTATSHGFSANNIVFVENVSETFDGYHTVQEVITPAQFTVVISGINIAESDTDTVNGSPRVTRRASVRYGTFGEHTTKGDIGLDLTDTLETSGNAEANPIIRGFELRTVAEVLEDYSTKPNGFEYRIDCSYDSTTKTFKKYFKFLPLIPTELTQWLAGQPSGYTGAIPASAYGADSRIFEFPGNILEAQFEETAEDSATRFFVQGTNPALSSDASQPYSSASNHLLLNSDWPILDAVENMDSEDETVLWKQASRLLAESVPPISVFSISVNGSANPKLGTYNPGDWCTVKLNDDFVNLRAASSLEQDYGTDDGALVRKIQSYSVKVPDSPGYPEEVELELVTEPAIPISGVQVINGKAFLG